MKNFATIGIDLGATKLSSAIIDSDGNILYRNVEITKNLAGERVGDLIVNEVGKSFQQAETMEMVIKGVGLCVPGIFYPSTGCIWAPNIKDWENYPLLDRLTQAFSGLDLKFRIESDRTCYILGETWMGVAKGSANAIFMAVGTGIGAGILCDGRILRGHGDIAGAIGWLALADDFQEAYRSCGCFEYYASGSGLEKFARDISENPLADAKILFEAFEHGSPEATHILQRAIKYWGKASANLVSIFNPEILIFGGGLFGPAARFIAEIRNEAALWAQPVSMKQVRFEVSSLAGDAGLIGAGRLPFIDNI